MERKPQQLEQSKYYLFLSRVLDPKSADVEGNKVKGAKHFSLLSTSLDYKRQLVLWGFWS